MLISALQANLGTVQQFINPHTFAWVTFGLGVGAVILRYVKQECIDDATGTTSQ